MIQDKSETPVVVFSVGGGLGILRQHPQLAGKNAIVVGLDADEALPKIVVKNGCTIFNVKIADAKGLPDVVNELMSLMNQPIAELARSLQGTVNITAATGAGQRPDYGLLQYMATTIEPTFEAVCVDILKRNGGTPPNSVELLLAGGLAGGTGGGALIALVNDFITYMTARMPSTPICTFLRSGRFTFSDLPNAESATPNLGVNTGAATAATLGWVTTKYPDKRVKQAIFTEFPPAAGDKDLRDKYTALYLQALLSSGLYGPFQEKLNNTAANHQKFGHVAILRTAYTIMESSNAAAATAAAFMIGSLRRILSTQFVGKEAPEVSVVIVKDSENGANGHEALLEHVQDPDWQRVPGAEKEFLSTGRTVTANVTMKRGTGEYLSIPTHIKAGAPTSKAEYVQRREWLASMEAAVQTVIGAKVAEVADIQAELEEQLKLIMGALKVLKPVKFLDQAAGLIVTKGATSEKAVTLLEGALENYASTEHDLQLAQAELAQLEHELTVINEGIATLEYYLTRAVEELDTLSASGGSDDMFILDDPDKYFESLVEAAALDKEEVKAVCELSVIGLTLNGIARLFGCEPNIHAIVNEIRKGGKLVSPKWATNLPGTPLFSFLSLPKLDPGVFRQIQEVLQNTDDKTILSMQDGLVAGIAAVWIDHYMPRTIEEAMGIYLQDLERAYAMHDFRLSYALLPGMPTLKTLRDNIALIDEEMKRKIEA